MRFRCVLEGVSAVLMHNGAAGLDAGSAWNVERAGIARKRAGSRTAADELRLRELECLVSLWLDDEGRPTVPASAVRAVIEAGARKVRQGPLVREGLRVEAVEGFGYDTDRYGTTLGELGTSAQFTAAVVVQRARILRTRAKFDVPWSLSFAVEADPELVGEQELARWLERLSAGPEQGVHFIIGGAFGLDAKLLQECDLTLSLSPFTLPHDLARLVMAEQLYRAGTILRREPYHKGRD